MNLGMQIGQSQRLEQNISPQMLQAAAILQKTSQELDIAINEELSANPLLEMDDEVPEDTGAEESADDSGDDGEIREMDFESGNLEDTADHDYDISDNVIDTDMERRLTDGSYDEDAPFKDLNAPSKDASDEWDRPQKDRDKSLQDNLRDQLRDWNGNSLLVEQLKDEGCSEEHFRTLVQYLIDSLDEDGFLQGAPDEVMMKMAADRGEDKFIVEIGVHSPRYRSPRDAGILHYPGAVRRGLPGTHSPYTEGTFRRPDGTALPEDCEGALRPGR